MKEIIISFLATMESLTIKDVINVAAYTFFFVTLAVFVWQVYRYIGFVKKAILMKKIGLTIIVQSFFTIYLILIAMLSAGINGFTGIFWVFSFIGFSLTLIFMIDQAAKREKKIS
ncbi:MULTISPECIES: hypothetical protein [Bacillaceae]|uniref:Uncharacterized protein n=1 Tax=Domibacillus aminovorans TaxID=29332 RepID=A0A177KWY3_9BACI|nr:MULTISPECIES: hypothetical protein [Bacillaceae]OAH57898.1 hypothetical protein AWH48_02505 [Domibacillus aminovorans]